MNHELHDTGSKALEVFARNSERMAEAAAMFTATMRSIVPPSEVLAAMAARSAAVYEQIRRDAERIGEETRKSIILATQIAQDFRASHMTIAGHAIAGRAFAPQSLPVTEHFERIN